MKHISYLKIAADKTDIVIKIGFEKVTHDIQFQPVTVPKGKELVKPKHVYSVKEYRKDGQSYVIQAQVLRQASVSSQLYITKLNVWFGLMICAKLQVFHVLVFTIKLIEFTFAVDTIVLTVYYTASARLRCFGYPLQRFARSDAPVQELYARFGVCTLAIVQPPQLYTQLLKLNSNTVVPTDSSIALATRYLADSIIDFFQLALHSVKCLTNGIISPHEAIRAFFF